MKLKISWMVWNRITCAMLLLFIGLSPTLANLQLVSALDGSTPVSDTANGDSSCPIITPDGRYVLFDSTANNLVLTNGNGPIPEATPHTLNGYFRDQTNGVATPISVNLSGDAGNGDSIISGISTNSQHVAF